ncbi:ComF family protein [Tissierella creatinophila]|uniref:Ribose-phosphate pyrophosphokinase n=1 Tax=Tissierella creatinophila DSM 6911 TaxID=1123403 RepID=A0A1U7M3F2_TISCR|nr:ComF family protein [Tissierella creatinophila]OLS01842.1 ribose-phosphate pyrophosphokinase [Tissierella creatinophila DSM 6911]
MEYIKSVFDLIFPTKNLCYFCNEDELKIENYICRSCRNNIEIVNKEVFLDSSFISECYYTTIYDRFMKDIIRRYKFNDKSFLYKPLGEILLKTIYEKNLDKKVDLIAFVPSHRRKEAIRGYNQSELLAMFVSKELHIPLLKTLIKSNHTLDQHFLDKEDRKHNLKDVFKVKRKEDVEEKSILLIDDIITSGSTMEECAMELIKNEAKAIFALALTSSRKI